jgi:hypothetical protein
MVKQFNPNTDKYLYHNSPEEYLEFLRTNARRIRNLHWRAEEECDDPWAGLAWDGAINKLQFGDDGLAAEAQKIVDKMNDEDILSIGRSVIQSDVVGFMPNVPAVLAGIPNNMFTRTNIETENVLAPLSIYIDTSVSSGISNDEILNRGVSVLAFVMAMNTVRPIDLYVTSTWAFSNKAGTGCNVVKITTMPLDLARATWILTAREYVRRFSFAVTHYICDVDDFMDAMPPGWHDYSYCGPHWERCLRRLLNIDDSAIVLGGGSIFNTKVRSDPVSWVREMIKEHVGKER